MVGSLNTKEIEKKPIWREIKFFNKLSENFHLKFWVSYLKHSFALTKMAVSASTDKIFQDKFFLQFFKSKPRI